MTLLQELYLAMSIAGFGLFIVTLMTVWIATRGWAPRDKLQPNPASTLNRAEPEAPRLAA
jgi:hypothetical protein